MRSSAAGPNIVFTPQRDQGRCGEVLRPPEGTALIAQLALLLELWLIVAWLESRFQTCAPIRQQIPGSLPHVPGARRPARGGVAVAGGLWLADHSHKPLAAATLPREGNTRMPPNSEPFMQPGLIPDTEDRVEVTEAVAQCFPRYGNGGLRGLRSVAQKCDCGNLASSIRVPQQYLPSGQTRWWSKARNQLERVQRLVGLLPLQDGRDPSSPEHPSTRLDGASGSEGCLPYSPGIQPLSLLLAIPMEGADIRFHNTPFRSLICTWW
ncbi:hypothetical protein NDU88_002777 [Pleurodeles waltl]|uniref:Uncharacterized protein n=1 Tax=Pleurodeles waltl TaxID=8319 RepID=A0AAV7NIV7_PLEWA|nr:hypothetical protein NDU88_002777 [Pleurodeles waltl]